MNPDDTNPQPVSNDFTFCYFPSWGTPIAALIDIQPDTINIDSKGTDSVITCNVTLPADYDISLVNTSTIKMRVGGTEIFAQSAPVKVMDKNKPYIMVKFNRSAVINASDGIPGDYDISVSGKLTNGLSFEGYDVIKVVSR